MPKPRLNFLLHCDLQLNRWMNVLLQQSPLQRSGIPQFYLYLSGDEEHDSLFVLQPQLLP